MKIKNIKVNKFKNLESVNLEISPKVNLLFGENGHGKTNFLESIYYLTQTNSFKQGAIDNILPENVNPNLTKTIINGKINKKNLDYNLAFDYYCGKKQLLVNQKKEKQNQLSRKFPFIIFSPDSLSAIKSGSESRRKLIDDYLIIINENSYSLIQEFKKALKIRNRLLKMNLKNEISIDEFQKTFDSINQNFLKLSVELTNQRILALRDLLPFMNKALKYITADENVDISVEYVSSGINYIEKEVVEIAEMFAKRMKELEKSEISSGISLTGAQRHDISFLFNQKDSRYYCSQGQQRTLILAYKLAQIVYYHQTYKNYPILLLDDVMSELDLKKRKQLIKYLNLTDSQIFITTTDLENSLDMISNGGFIFKVKNGSIEKYQ